jgi:hypothetical protein
VYSKAQNQWFAALEGYMQGSYSIRTQYKIDDRGLFHIGRTVLSGPIMFNGQRTTPQIPYLETWTPFGVGAFDAMAMGIDGNGNPNWWYDPKTNLPNYPQWDVRTTNGYGIVFGAQAPTQRPAVAMVFGKGQVQTCIGDESCREQGIPGSNYVLNTKPFDVGMCVLPGLHTGPLQDDDVIEQHFIMVPRTTGVDSLMYGYIDEALKMVAPPRIYRQSSKMSSTLSNVVNNLKAYRSEGGFATDNLGPLVSNARVNNASVLV